MGLDIKNTNNVKGEQRFLRGSYGVRKQYEGMNIGVSKVHIGSYGIQEVEYYRHYLY